MGHGSHFIICGIRKQSDGADQDSKKTSPQAFTLYTDCNIVKRGWVANKKESGHPLPFTQALHFASI